MSKELPYPKLIQHFLKEIAHNAVADPEVAAKFCYTLVNEVKIREGAEFEIAREAMAVLAHDRTTSGILAKAQANIGMFQKPAHKRALPNGSYGL